MRIRSAGNIQSGSGKAILKITNFPHNDYHLDQDEVKSKSLTSPLQKSQRRLGEVIHEISIDKRHVRRAKIRPRQRRPRSSSQTLPGNERLLAADIARKTQLVVERPGAEIPNQGTIAVEIRGRGGVEVAVCGGGCAADRCSCALLAQPDDDALPVVPVPEPGARRVLRPVPRVHDPELVVVGACPAVDLAGAAAAGT